MDMKKMPSGMKMWRLTMSKVSYSPFLVVAATFAMSSGQRAYLAGEIARRRSARITRLCSRCRMAAAVRPPSGSAFQIPEGVVAVEPMPKPGWNVDVIKGKYSGEYDYHGTKLSDGAKEVWYGAAASCPAIAETNSSSAPS